MTESESEHYVKLLLGKSATEDQAMNERLAEVQLAKDEEFESGSSPPSDVRSTEEASRSEER